MKKTRILPLLAVALLCNCGGSDDKGPETGDGKITVVEPTTALGAPNDDISRLQLKPGKLITLKQVNTTNCKRAAAAGMCIDIMAQDATVFAEGMTDAKLDALFSEAGLRSRGGEGQSAPPPQTCGASICPTGHTTSRRPTKRSAPRP